MTPATPSPWPRRLELLAWCLLYLASRALTLAASANDLHRLDELYAGAAALEILAGRELPLALLAHAPYCGGSILVVAGAVLLFPMLGSSVLVLRLPSLLASLAVFLVWQALLGRLFGRRTARLFALLYVCAPPELARLTVMAWGNHAESALPTGLGLLALALLYGRGDRLVAGPGARLPALLAALAGAAFGFSLFFSYAALAPLAAAAVTLLALGPRALARGAGSGLLAGFAIGTAPVLALAVSRSVEGQWFLFAFLGRGQSQALLKPLRLFAYELRWFLRPEAGLGPVLESLWWAALVAALAGLALRLVRSRRLKTRDRGVAAEALLVLPFVTYSAAYAVSGFPIGPLGQGIMTFRYLAPMGPFAVAAVAAALGRLPRAVAWPLAGALALGPVLHLVRRAPAMDAGAARLSGASFLSYGGHISEVVDDDRSRIGAWLDRIPEPERRAAAYAAVGTVAAAHLHGGLAERPIPRLRLYLRGLRDDPERRLLVARLALFLETTADQRLTRDELDELLSAMNEVDEATAAPLARAAVFAYGRGGGAADPAALIELVEGLKRGWRARGAEALGMLAWSLSHGASTGVLPSAVPGDLRPGFVRGIAYATALDAVWREPDPSRWSERGAVLVPPGRAEFEPDWRLLDLAGGAELLAEVAAGIDDAVRVYEPEDEVRRAHAARARLGRLRAARSGGRP